MSHTFAIGNSSFQSWDAAKAAALVLAAQNNTGVPVTRDDGRVWTVSPRKQRPAAQQAAAPAQSTELAQLVALVKAQNSAIDELSKRLEALETRKRARSAK